MKDINAIKVWFRFLAIAVDKCTEEAILANESVLNSILIPLKKCLAYYATLLVGIEAASEAKEQPFGQAFMDSELFRDTDIYRLLAQEATADDFHQWLSIWTMHYPDPIVPIHAALAAAYSLYLRERTFIPRKKRNYPQYILLRAIRRLPKCDIHPFVRSKM